MVAGIATNRLTTSGQISDCNRRKIASVDVHRRELANANHADLYSALMKCRISSFQCLLFLTLEEQLNTFSVSRYWAIAFWNRTYFYTVEVTWLKFF